MFSRKVNKKLSIREYRSQVAILKRAGLISPRIDARSHKPTRYMKQQLERFKDVIKGDAVTVKTPSKKIAKSYDDVYRSKFDRVVVKKAPGDKIRYDKTQDAIVADRRASLPGVDKVTSVLRPREPGVLPNLPRDTKKHSYFYAIPFKRGNRIERIYINTKTELKKFMSPYDPKRGGKFADWQDYIEIIKAERSEPLLTAATDGKEKARASISRGATNVRSRTAKAQPRDSRGRFIERDRTPAKSRKHKAKI